MKDFVINIQLKTLNVEAYFVEDEKKPEYTIKLDIIDRILITPGIKFIWYGLRYYDLIISLYYFYDVIKVSKVLRYLSTVELTKEKRKNYFEFIKKLYDRVI